MRFLRSWQSHLSRNDREEGNKITQSNDDEVGGAISHEASA